MTTITRGEALLSSNALVSESAVGTVFDAASTSSLTMIMVEGSSDAGVVTVLTLNLMQSKRALTAKERWRRMAERARERLVTAPTYPDDPGERAEQDEVIRGLMDSQVRSLREP